MEERYYSVPKDKYGKDIVSYSELVNKHGLMIVDDVIGKNKYQEVIAICRNILNQDKDSFEALKLIGKSRLRINNNNDAILSQFNVLIMLCESFINSLTIVLPYYPHGTMERVSTEGTVATEEDKDKSAKASEDKGKAASGDKSKAAPSEKGKATDKDSKKK